MIGGFILQDGEIRERAKRCQRAARNSSAAPKWRHRRTAGRRGPKQAIVQTGCVFCSAMPNGARIFPALMDFLDELQNRILPGDGAMGTALMDAGVPLDRCFEELCVSQPDLVARVHAEYLAAGARVIETNSFGANAVRLAKHGMEHRVSELNWSAAQLAKEAAKGLGAYVAGSVGPLGITRRTSSRTGNRPAKRPCSPNKSARCSTAGRTLFFSGNIPRSRGRVAPCSRSEALAASLPGGGIARLQR